MVADSRTGTPWRTVALALIPLVLLAVVVYWLYDGGARRMFGTDLPPVEDVHVMRHTLEPDLILLDLVNAGPDPVTVAQVMVRGAFWQHEIEPHRTLEPLGRARLSIPFPWNTGEPVEIGLLTSTGLVFDYEIEVAAETPRPTLAALGRFAMLGIWVGVIPVGLGIAWFPVLRRLGRRGLGFIIHLTVGLLAFLAVDATFEGLEAAAELPGVFHGSALILLGLGGTWLVLWSVEARARERQGATPSGVMLAWLIALGIGLHNLGEGLAIGSAYVLGELTLGAMLVVGFTLHNATEGVAIVAPIAHQGAGPGRLIGLGALAGAPTVLGCWIGAFTYSRVWALLFLGMGAGAIVQVIGAILGRRPLAETLSPVNVAGLVAGYVLMYATGLMVGAA